MPVLRETGTIFAILVKILKEALGLTFLRQLNHFFMFHHVEII